MINFVLKYTGTYGLLAILAVAIIAPTYLFFSKQQEKLSDSSSEKQVVTNEEKVFEKTVPTKKIEKETIQKSEKKEASNESKKPSFEEVESLSVDVFRVDEFGNIISAGKVSKRAKIEIIADNNKIIGTDKKMVPIMI